MIIWFKVTLIFLYISQYDTRYYYEVGIGNTSRTFWFTTPPEVGPDVPYTFGLIGILFLKVLYNNNSQV